MTTTDTISLLEKKAHSRFIMAISFFLFCIILSGGLFIYDRLVLAKTARIEDNLKKVQQSIIERESDPLVESYELYQRNKSVFERLSHESRIPTFVSHIKMTAIRYGLEIKGFNYNEGKLSMSVRSDNDQRGFGYEKVVAFLSQYRDYPEALFHIDNVQAFKGHDRIEYDISLRLKHQNEFQSAKVLEEESENVGNPEPQNEVPEARESQE